MQRRLRLAALSASPTPPSAALGDWYVHLVNFGRQQVVLATSERSLLTVLLPARELRATLESNLVRAVQQLLVALEIPAIAIAREIAAMRPMAYAKAVNRRVLGSINEFVFQLGAYQYGAEDTLGLALRLADTPMSALGSKSRYGIPSETAHELLAGENLGELRRH
jgi:hypothetical protein